MSVVPSELPPSERAQMHRRHGNIRVPLHKIGFWSGNRGGSCCVPTHVHEIARDITVMGTKLDRYVHVVLVKIPQDKLAEVREANKRRSERFPLMPPSAPEMEYVLVAKTHFTFAHKLIKQGGRVLHDVDEGQQVLRLELQADDEEGHQIQASGPVAVIYGEELFDDDAAMASLASQDNMQATICYDVAGRRSWKRSRTSLML
jgi:hypothetical protein